MVSRGNKGTTHKLSEIDLFVLTGSILCLDRCRHDSILESARFRHLDIVLEKALFLSIFRMIPIEMVWIQFPFSERCSSRELSKSRSSRDYSLAYQSRGRDSVSAPCSHCTHTLNKAVIRKNASRTSYFRAVFLTGGAVCI